MEREGNGISVNKKKKTGKTEREEKMGHPKGGGTGVDKKGGGEKLVAVAIDKDKGSQYALKWAVENLLSRGQTVVLIHVLNKPNPNNSNSALSCTYHPLLIYYITVFML